MFKKLLLLSLIIGTINIAAFDENMSFPKGTTQGIIINAIYQIGASEKLTLLLVVNDKKIKAQDKEALQWTLDNIKAKFSFFWYCKHELENPKVECISRHVKDLKGQIKYVQLSCFEPLYDLCGKNNIATLFIFKNGLIVHKISCDLLLSNKILPHKKEQDILNQINETYRKALTMADF